MSKKVILLNNNDFMRSYTGVDKFHKAGYYGSRVVAGSGECWTSTLYNPYGNVLEPMKTGFGSGHGLDTAFTFFQVAPLAKLVQLPYYYKNNSDGTYSSCLLDAVSIIKELKISNIFYSFTSTQSETKTKLETQALREIESFCKLFVLAGNDYGSDYNDTMKIEETFGVGAYHLNTGTPVAANYSSESEYVDFAAPSRIYINPNAKDEDDYNTYYEGTSFSTPWLCGMACLVDDFFIDKTGMPLTRENMRQFFMDNCKDIHDKGFDKKTGYGAVILPDPNTINIDKYKTKESYSDQFKDKDLISSWARNSINKCIANGFMNGKGDNMFDPKCPLTREEMACVLDRVYSKLENMINKYVL